MNRRSALSTVMLTVALLPLTAQVAGAYDGRATVSCDVSITSTLVTLNHTSGGIAYKQADTSENNNRYNWAVSSNGNSLTRKATVDGQTVSWTGVSASNYTFKTRIVGNQNCNGALPGQGNSSLAYTANTNR